MHKLLLNTPVRAESKKFKQNELVRITKQTELLLSRLSTQLTAQLQYWLLYQHLLWDTLGSGEATRAAQHVLNLSYSSRQCNQRCFYTMSFDWRTLTTASVGSVARDNNVVTKHLRSSRKGLLLLLHHSSATVMRYYNTLFIPQNTIGLHVFKGATRRFLALGQVLNKLYQNSTLGLQVVVFKPAHAFQLRKFKNYKAIKKSYRRTITKMERSSNFF